MAVASQSTVSSSCKPFENSTSSPNAAYSARAAEQVSQTVRLLFFDKSFASVGGPTDTCIALIAACQADIAIAATS